MAYLEELTLNTTKFQIPDYKAGDNVHISEDKTISVDLDGVAEQAKELYGTPLVASTVAGMTDHTKVYVYTGSESGYTNGHWYYWNGSAWTDGGVYNSAAVNTDTTLSISGMPADAKATGDAVNDLKEDLLALEQEGYPMASIQEAVDTWAYEHEAEIVNSYVTPKMFGAKGDGVTDDTNAVQQAINSGSAKIIIPSGTYLLNKHITLISNIEIVGQGETVFKWVDSDALDNATSYIGNQNLENVIIKNVIFDFGTLEDLRYGLSILDSVNIYVTNCTFRNCYGYATRFNNCSNLHITNCYFEDITGAAGNPGGAIYGADFHDVFITRCGCSNIGDHFVYCAGSTEIYNVVISDCNINTTGVNALTNGAGIVVYANSHDITITNCNFKQTRQGIYIGQYGDYQSMPHDIDISNCVFDHMATIAIEVYGISSSVYVYRVNISNISVNETSSDAMLFRHAVRMNVNNINIDRPYRYGMEISDVQQSSFSKIIISGIRDVGIYVSNSSYSPDSSYNIFDGFVLTPRSGALSGSIGFYHKSGAYNICNNIIAFGFGTNIIKTGAFMGSFNINKFNENRAILFTSDITESLYHNKGDIIFNVNPTSGNPVMWVCTAAGIPGTMTPLFTLP